MMEMSSITVSEEWDVLGPFSVGTREALWGADPLERVGGFRALSKDDKSQIRSSLAPNGTASWSIARAKIKQATSVEVLLDISFPEVDWPFQQQIYGWSALQWQGWARGSINVDFSRDVLLHMHPDQILEVWIDGKHHFGGDFYGFRRAPTLLSLSPGSHKVDIRLIRDVRSMGGITSNPALSVALVLTLSTAALQQSSAVLLPDRLEDGSFASSYGSVDLTNNTAAGIFITSVRSTTACCAAYLLPPMLSKLASGQTRPIAFGIEVDRGTDLSDGIDLVFQYSMQGATYNFKVTVTLKPPVSKYGPQLITYIHPAGVVSKAILRPPSKKHVDQEELPILLSLHGAGVDVESQEARSAFDGVSDIPAWTLLPSGGTSWCGDDWHTWGRADAEAAIEAIPTWIEQHQWEGADVDLTRWLVAGHSNGGQGLWYALTHYPDNIIAAAPVSGYTSIQNYVPYIFWRNADPGRMAIVQAQLSNYRHELLLENANDIPILQQHGTVDDNVPVYHSRLMFELLQAAGNNNTYHEVPGQPHWWDGIMTTPWLKAFYNDHLSAFTKVGPDSFKLVTASNGASITRHGFQLVELETPGRLGCIEIAGFNSKRCMITTTNVQRLSIDASVAAKYSELVIDNHEVDKRPVGNEESIVLVQSEDHAWNYETRHDTDRRTARQSGGLEAILKTNGNFEVVEHSSDIHHVAVEVANNLTRYLGADVCLTNYEQALDRLGNVISIAIGDDLPAQTAACKTQGMISIDSKQLIFSKSGHTLHSIDVQLRKIAAAVYLRPLPNSRLELVIWAKDRAFLQVGSRLLPIITGAGVPDFVVATEDMLDRGLDGVYALGFFDSDWCPASTSFFAS